MERLIRYSPAFRRALNRHGITPGTPDGKLIARETNRLAELAALPAQGDRAFMMPPSVSGWLHLIPDAAYVLGYDFDNSTLFLLTLKVRDPG